MPDRPGPAGPPTVPYGAWPSPIAAADVAGGALRLSGARLVGDGEVWWTEGRPAEGGRSVVVRCRYTDGAAGETSDVLPPGWNARTRVHEYGGVPWLPVQVDGGTALVFAHWDDQRLYRLDPGSTTPVPLTPIPPEPAGWRYADPVAAPGGAEVWWVREAHADGGISRALVAVPLDGSAAVEAAAVRQVVAGSDFLASPRPSPDGRRVAWIAWDHPRMPWDGTELRVGELGSGAAAGTVGTVATLLGGEAESVLQPEWAGDGQLYAVSDRSGWWNLHRVPAGGGEPVPLCARPEEFGHPLWQLGYTTYAVLDDGRLVVRHGTDTDALGVLDPATGELTDLPLPFTSWQPMLAAAGRRVVGVAASPTEAPSVVVLDLPGGRVRRLRASLPAPPDPDYLPEPRSVTVSGPGRAGRARARLPAPVAGRGATGG